jgi:sodium-dependent dicarboxylate transporter 2/3/5
MNDSSTRKRDTVAYRDSRSASLRILNPQRRHELRRLLLFIAVSLMAFATWSWLTADLPMAERAVLFLFMLSVGLWVTEAVPAFAVGLLIMGYLVFVLGTPLLLAQPLVVEPYVGMWSSPVIWLMLGGFFLAEGLARTRLDRKLFRLAMQPAGDRPPRVLLAVMLTTAVASMFISNTSTTALMIGAVLPLVRDLGKNEPFSRALLVGIPLAASVGGMGTIIGSAPNAIAVGVAAEFGYHIDFIEWMMFGVPVALGLVLVGWRLMLNIFPPGIERVSLVINKSASLTPSIIRDRRVVAAIGLLTIGMWMTTPLHGVHPAAIALIPIVGLTITRVLSAEDMRALPWDTLMLVAGGLALGAAMVDTGLAARLASGLSGLSDLQWPVLVYVLLALLTVMMSNFMSNTATVSLVLPVAVALVPGNELALCLVLGLSASCALFLPVSTPPNAVAFGTGLLETRDLRSGGILIGLLGPALIVLWVALVLLFV